MMWFLWCTVEEDLQKEEFDFPFWSPDVLNLASDYAWFGTHRDFELGWRRNWVQVQSLGDRTGVHCHAIVQLCSKSRDTILDNYLWLDLIPLLGQDLEHWKRGALQGGVKRGNWQCEVGRCQSWEWQKRFIKEEWWQYCSGEERWEKISFFC